MSTRPFSADYWSAVEVIGPDQARAMQESRLAEQLAYLAANSEFYRAKFAEHSVNIDRVTTLDHLADLPFTEKQELRDSLAEHPPLGSHVAAPMSEIVPIQASSGTTGSPSYVGLTESDITIWSELGARALYANGFRPGDRMLHGFGMSKGFVGGLPVVQIARHMGIVDIPIGAEAGAERLLRVQADQRPEALIGTPNFLAYLAEQAPDIVGVPAAELGVRSISVGGEPGGGLPAIRDKLQSLWGATSREMLGGTDLGCIYWGECEAGEGMHFHSPDLIIAEIIDPADGQVLAPAAGVEGEVVYTALGRRASGVAAAALPHPRSRRRHRHRLRLRSDRIQGSVCRAHRRHAHRPRHQRVPVSGEATRGGDGAAHHRAHPYPPRLRGSFHPASTACGGRSRRRRRPRTPPRGEGRHRGPDPLGPQHQGRCGADRRGHAEAAGSRQGRTGRARRRRGRAVSGPRPGLSQASTQRTTSDSSAREVR